jgi:hypothetical protein
VSKPYLDRKSVKKCENVQFASFCYFFAKQPQITKLQNALHQPPLVQFFCSMSTELLFHGLLLKFKNHEKNSKYFQQVRISVNYSNLTYTVMVFKMSKSQSKTVQNTKPYA